jgi:hypothetical protein
VIVGRVYYKAGVVVVNSQVEELAPGVYDIIAIFAKFANFWRRKLAFFLKITGMMIFVYLNSNYSSQNAHFPPNFSAKITSVPVLAAVGRLLPTLNFGSLFEGF